MIDINKKYRTREGHEVRIYATDGKGRKSVHGAYFDNYVKGWVSLVWTEHGKVDVYQEIQPMDLIEVRPRHKRTVWVNVYRDDWDAYTAASKEDADENASEDRIACIKIELNFEKGEGL